MVRDSRIDSVALKFFLQPYFADAMYGLLLSAVNFLFLPFFRLLHHIPWHQCKEIDDFGTLPVTMVAVYTGHIAFPILRAVMKILPQMRTLTSG